MCAFCFRVYCITVKNIFLPFCRIDRFFDRIRQKTYRPVGETTKENLGGIIDNLLAGLKNRLASAAVGNLGLEVTDAAKSLIIEGGFDPVYGARPLKRYLQSAAETLIAKVILKGDVKAGSTLVLDAKDGILTCTSKAE